MGFVYMFLLIMYSIYRNIRLLVCRKTSWELSEWREMKASLRHRRAVVHQRLNTIYKLHRHTARAADAVLCTARMYLGVVVFTERQTDRQTRGCMARQLAVASRQVRAGAGAEPIMFRIGTTRTLSKYLRQSTPPTRDAIDSRRRHDTSGGGARVSGNSPPPLPNRCSIKFNGTGDV